MARKSVQIPFLLPHDSVMDVVHVLIQLPVLGPVIVQGLPTLQECCDIHSLHAFFGHWVLCGCVLPCGTPLPPVVHQHKGDGHRESENKAMSPGLCQLLFLTVVLVTGYGITVGCARMVPYMQVLHIS